MNHLQSPPKSCSPINPHSPDIQNESLLVFSDDWGRHPSSCQHLVRCLLPQTRVTWVNTIGMRPPRLDRLTLARGAGKLRDWATGGSNGDGEALPENLVVRDPRMWPWMSHAWDRTLNARLLTRQLRGDAEDAIGVTTIPITADLVGRLPVRRWVYYCVDDFSVWPGLAGNVMQQMERKLLAGVDCVVAASDHLADAIRPYHDDVSVLTHGVDVSFWSSPSQATERSAPGELAPVTDPVALFWGVVDRRMDAEWVLALADAMTSGTIVLAGPQQNPDPRLLQHSRIECLGALPIEQLPRWAARAAMLIMPYADLPVTRAMQPLKLKEYLATGRPVIAANLPAVEPWADCLQMVTDRDSFVATALPWLSGAGASAEEAARQARRTARLATEDWHAKARRFQQRLLG